MRDRPIVLYCQIPLHYVTPRLPQGKLFIFPTSKPRVCHVKQPS